MKRTRKETVRQFIRRLQLTIMSMSKTIENVSHDEADLVRRLHAAKHALEEERVVHKAKLEATLAEARAHYVALKKEYDREHAKGIKLEEVSHALSILVQFGWRIGDRTMAYRVEPHETLRMEWERKQQELRGQTPIIKEQADAAATPAPAR